MSVNSKEAVYHCHVLALVCLSGCSRDACGVFEGLTQASSYGRPLEDRCLQAVFGINHPNFDMFSARTYAALFCEHNFFVESFYSIMEISENLSK